VGNFKKLIMPFIHKELAARARGKLGPFTQAGNGSVDGMPLAGRPLPQSGLVLIGN
jgi:hypothetical protein